MKTEIKIEDILNLKRILTLLNKAESIFNRLSNETKERVHEFHTENHGLDHCLRWGPQAAEEFLQANEPEDPSKKKFYRATFLLEVVSEKPIPDEITARDALQQAYNGEWSGKEVDLGREETGAREMTVNLEDQGSSPEFFRIDEED